ncbi:dTDP-4-dehydrorhamnose 3,5-epimerase [Pseudonocardia sp. KRD291]|uniref:dTDP-4-dehydrorhamnose 3,5-epimerase family protein n=1 Tax=Pseudonocardia sp. KRD291 TaxID=2792007 RepID=UPI001C5C03E4|nr:dTDP-4-dehydrorhamnose 3,5-epimerase [Pseudonocardia sp. KRD291]MBW0105121.1 dTDP-4-dehydrorhamnose 3,5-epimerase family protein [Pseudonocardia sp. KRD291]
MQVHRSVIDGVVQFVPVPHVDEHGFRTVTFDSAVAAAHGLDAGRFIQDSQSRSVQGVIRGMHGRTGAGESKLVRCAHGAMHDIVVDARPGSPTFGRVATFLLDDVERRHLYIPAGCLHGFQALSPTVDTCYRIDTPHDPTEDVSVRFDDPDLAIRWPLPVGTMSTKDRAAGTWAELCARLGVSAPAEPIAR